MSTPFMYPNGEYVDVFLNDGYELFNRYRLSDYGQTTQYLRGAMVAASSTSRKKEIINDITKRLNVEFADHLFIDLEDEEMGDISDAILRLSQACVRISDMATHQRLRSSNPFRDDVEDFLDAQRFSFVPDVMVAGLYGRDIRLDFEVKSPSRPSYLNVLGSLNESSAHAISNEITLKWIDLDKAGSAQGHRFITVYNSLTKAIRKEDFARLKEHSDMVSYPDEHDFLASLLTGDTAQVVIP